MYHTKSKYEGFAEIYQFQCDGCGILLDDRYHCVDCGVDLCADCAGSVEAGHLIKDHSKSHRTVLIQRLPFISGQDYIEQESGLFEDIERDHVAEGVTTFLANNIRATLTPFRGFDKSNIPPGLDEQTKSALESLRFYLTRRKAGRYVDYFERRSFDGTELPGHVLALSQGAQDCMRWKGMPLYKSVFDVCLYPMILWELQPKTIFETGSANGSSALWLGDMMDAYGIDGHIYSLDLIKPDVTHDRVTFIEGDSNNIEQVFPRELLAKAPHPWWFLEDAHVNVVGVLSYFHEYMQSGDCVIVEDSDSTGKGDEIGQFAIEHRDHYRVDTRYTDYFGYNMTCSRDTIWRRV